MLASLEALQRLRGVHLRRRGQDDRIEPRQLESVREIGRDMANAIFRRRLFCLVELAADEGDRLDLVDQLDRIKVPEAEGACAGERDFECLGHGVSEVLEEFSSKLRRVQHSQSLSEHRHRAAGAARLRRSCVEAPRALEHRRCLISAPSGR